MHTSCHAYAAYAHTYTITGGLGGGGEQRAGTNFTYPRIHASSERNERPAVSLTNLGHRYSATTLSLPVHAHGILGEAVRQTLRARGGGVEHGVGVGRLDCGRDVGDVVGQEGLGRRAALAVLREVGGAGEPRLLREDAYCNRCNGRRDWVSRDSNSV